MEGDLVELEGTERDGRIHTSDVLVLGSRRGGEVRGRVRGKWFDRRALAGFIASALISIVFLVLLIVGGTYVYWQVQSSSPQNGMANCLVTAPAEVCANLFGSGLPEPPTWDEKMEMCLEVSSRTPCNETLARCRALEGSRVMSKQWAIRMLEQVQVGAPGGGAIPAFQGATFVRDLRTGDVGHFKFVGPGWGVGAPIGYDAADDGGDWTYFNTKNDMSLDDFADGHARIYGGSVGIGFGGGAGGAASSSKRPTSIRDGGRATTSISAWQAGGDSVWVSGGRRETSSWSELHASRRTSQRQSKLSITSRRSSPPRRTCWVAGMRTSWSTRQSERLQAHCTTFEIKSILRYTRRASHRLSRMQIR